MNTIYTRASNHGDDIAGLMLVVLGDTDVSRITSDTDPVNWHVVAQDRATWKSTIDRRPDRPHYNKNFKFRTRTDVQSKSDGVLGVPMI